MNEEIKDISAQEKLMNFRYEPKHNLLKFEIKIKGHRLIWKGGHPKSSIFTLKLVPWMDFV